MLTDFTAELSGGLNIISGANESGKSTVAEFIRFVLYGFNGKPDRERYTGFSSSSAEGSLILREGDKRYRVERKASGTKETCGIYDLDTGSLLHEGKVPGEVFFGVPMHVFESTAAVRQTRCTTLHTSELGSSIENMLFTGDESLNTQRASAKLDSVRRTLLHKNGKGGRLYELEEEKREISERLTRARMSAAAMVDREMKIEDLKKQTARQRERLASCEETCNNFENLALLRRFTQLHDLEKKTVALQGQLDEMYRTHARDGYLPDDAYLSDLRSRKMSLRLARQDPIHIRTAW